MGSRFLGFWGEAGMSLCLGDTEQMEGGGGCDTLVITVRSQLSAQLPQKIFIQDIMPLPWPHSSKGGSLHPQHQVLITPNTAVPTVSYLPLCLHSVPEDRSTLLQAKLSLVPVLANQPVSHPPAPQKVVPPCPPPQKTGCCGRTVQKRSFGPEDACPEMSPNPREG